jgi:hypothetical protein
LTAANILAKSFVDAEMPVEMSVTFCATFIGIQETTGTCATLKILRVV